nr:hypothetical protein Iba_chr12bCG10740 [Ipomoea batatas]
MFYRYQMHMVWRISTHISSLLHSSITLSTLTILLYTKEYKTSSLRRISRFCKILLSHSAIALACFRKFVVRSCSSAFHSLLTSSIVFPVISDGNLGEVPVAAPVLSVVLLLVAAIGADDV